MSSQIECFVALAEIVFKKERERKNERKRERKKKERERERTEDEANFFTLSVMSVCSRERPIGSN